MKNGLILMLLFCAGTLVFSQTDEQAMNAQDAKLKAITLSTRIADKKAAAEAEKTRIFKLYDKELADEAAKVGKEKKDEFETTSEFNARIEAKRLEIAEKYRLKKEDYIKTVYEVEIEKNIKSLEAEYSEIMSSVYDLPSSYFKLTIGKYNADGNYYDMTFTYYIRTVEDAKTKKKVYIWEDPPMTLRWEIERDKAKEINPLKDSLVKTVKASVFKLPDGTFTVDKYDLYLIDPRNNSVLYNTLVFKDPGIKKMLTSTKVKSDEKIATQIFTPTIPNLRLRDSAVTGNVIRLLASGEKLKIIEKGSEDVIEGNRGRWVKVRSADKGDEGWSFDYFLKESK